MAATFASSCSTLLAPTSAEVTRGSRSARQAQAARGSGRGRGDLVQGAQLLATSSVRRSGDSVLCCVARDPFGMPSRYLSVSIPCASGEKTMDPIPSSPSVSSSSSSIQRSASSTRAGGSRAASRLAQDRVGLRRLAGRVRGDPHVQRLPLPDGRVQRAHRLLERRLGVEAVRVEDVDVSRAIRPRLWSRLASRYFRDPTRRTGRATCRIRLSRR